jgi:RNA polymerase sigma-70 factor (ECF subfamily)
MMKSVSKSRLEILVEEAYPRLERFAISICRNKNEAEEVISETMLIAIEKYQSLKDETTFISFLFTIASRVKVNLFRKNNRFISMEAEYFDFLRSSVQSPEDLMDIRLLYEALDKLEYKMREAIILFDITGLTYKEIALIQNSTLVAVKLRIHRGRKKLAKLLDCENDFKQLTPKYQGVEL